MTWKRKTVIGFYSRCGLLVTVQGCDATCVTQSPPYHESKPSCTHDHRSIRDIISRHAHFLDYIQHHMITILYIWCKTCRHDNEYGLAISMESMSFHYIVVETDIISHKTRAVCKHLNMKRPSRFSKRMMLHDVMSWY
jgi:hypothetical protein